MHGRLILICAGSPAVREGRFPPTHTAPRVEASAASPAATGARAFAAPEAAALSTAAALALVADAEPALRDVDHGRWSGERIAAVAAREPAAFAAWLADPAVAPHGGESLAAASARTAAWLERQIGARGEAMAVVGPTVLRLLLCNVLGSDLRALHAIDVEPGARVTLTSDGRRFRLRLPATRPG